MISFLFTTSSLPFSKLTRWGLDTDCSHFALGFDLDRPSGIVFHSDFMGVHIDFFSHFLVKNRIVHGLEFTDKLTLDQEELIYTSIIQPNYKHGYDYGAYLFWCLNIIGNKAFNLEISKKNLWESKEKYLCTEIYSSLCGVKVTETITFPTIKNTSMINPYDLYLELKACPFFRDLSASSLISSPLAQ